jgi:hypothetical protein
MRQYGARHNALRTVFSSAPKVAPIDRRPIPRTPQPIRLLRNPLKSKRPTRKQQLQLDLRHSSKWSTNSFG